jgi:myo-inositol-1(or 4)-monophosphatase
MSETLEFATQLAYQAGRVLLDYLARDTPTRLKSDRSVVTQADLAADSLISETIRRQYPGEMILSEESQPQLDSDPSGAVWIIDPLDGTTNFSLGLPFWGISIARIIEGNPETSVIYFPKLEELYCAERGQGAQFNGNPLVVKPPDPDQHAAFFSCCSRTYRHYQIRIPYKPRILGAATYSLCCVARGIALIGFEATPKIWDIAATWLLVSEAGGAIETLNHVQIFPVRGNIDYNQVNYPTLAAATPQMLSWARGKITPL